MNKPTKIQISVDSDLLKRANEFADSNYTTRSGLFCLALRQYLDSQEAIQAIKRISVVMQVISEKGEIDDEAKKELDRIDTIIKLISSSKLV